MNRLNPAWIPGNDQHPILVQPQAPSTELTPDQKAKQSIEYDKHVRQRASQITFYPYDRGQCYDKRTQAVMAFVNVPGAAAHYAWSSQTRVWAFVQLPHMSSEQRCAERMGYGSVDKMRRELFKLFDGWLGKNGMGMEIPERTPEQEAATRAYIQQKKAEILEKHPGVLIMDGMGSLPGELRPGLVDLMIKPGRALLAKLSGKAAMTSRVAMSSPGTSFSGANACRSYGRME